MGTVTHGADTRRLRAIAEDLQAMSAGVGRIESEGTAGLGVLNEAWTGNDCATFEGDWQEASSRLASVEQRLRAYARLLTEQAEQQDTASGGSGGSGGGGSGTAPGRGGRPGLPPGVIDLMDTLVDSGQARPDPAANLGDPHWRWAVRKGVDEGTDWANDVYKDHVRGTPFAPGLPFVEKGLEESSDWVEDLSEKYKEKKTNPLPFDGPSIFLDMVADELDTYRKILQDPKGWWENDASTLDKIAIGISVIPGAGIAAKAAIKSTKEAFDSIAKALRRGDDVDPPKVTPKGKKIGSYTVPDDAIKMDSGGKGNWNTELYDPKPNSTYLVDDKFAYVTDEHGRVKEAHGILADDPQDAAKHRQGKAGGEDRLPDDHGGHIFGKALGGPGEDINLLPMSKDANLSQYASLEREWRSLLKQDPPADIEATVTPVYPGDSQRPSRFMVEWTKDGVPQKPRTIDNGG